jgi:hypothetical protein
MLGQQLGRLVGRVREHVATLAHLAVLGGQDPVHGALAGEVAAFVEQRGVDLRGRAIGEPRAAQLGQNGCPLGAR